MVAIDPENVRWAATNLRSRARLAGELDVDLRSAALLSHLDASLQLAACAEIDEELSLLATMLTARADEAAGFFLPGNSWDMTSTLLTSLFDGVGAEPAMTGPLALHVLMDQAIESASDGKNPTSTDDPFDALVFTVADLEALASNPRTTPDLARAAAFLVTNPDILEVTRAWEGTGATLPSHHAGELPLRDIKAFLERNDVLSVLLGTQRVVSADDLFTDLDDVTLIAAGIDPEHFNSLALPRNGHDLLVAAIDHGTFNTSPQVARDFAFTLPVHYLDGQSIDITATDPGAIQRLYEAATIDLGSTQEDFMVHSLLVGHLPETTAATRNEWITSNYAEVAHFENARLNGTTPADDATFRGNNWFHLGVAASDSVSVVIEQEQRSLAFGPFPGFATPTAVTQEVADGNQAIYHHFISGLVARWSGRPAASPDFDQAYDLLQEAAQTDDIAQAQLLVAESTMLFAIEEQRIVDPYLQLDGLGLIDEGGTLLATGLPDTAMNFLSGQPVPARPRTAGQVMTDEGQLVVQADGDDLIPPIEISGPIPPTTQANNTVDPATLADLLPTEFDWLQTEADHWPDLDQRMPIIFDVTLASLTEPAFTTLADHHRNGNLDDPQPPH